MRQLDRIAAICGLFLGLFLILRPIINQKPILQSGIIGGILIVLCAIYLYWETKGRLLLDMPQLFFSNSARKLINICFFSLLTYNIISLYFSPDPYIRPAGYFISIFLMIGILTVEILSIPRNKTYAYFVLLKIIIIPLSIVWSQMLMFDTVVAADPWVHQQFTQEILGLGAIPDASGYFIVPVMHLINALTISITGLSYKIANMFSISFLQTLIPLSFVFLLGRHFFNAKVGLLAALLLGISNIFNSFVYWTIPFTFAATLILVVTYQLFKIRQDRNLESIILALLIMAIIILSHPMTSLCMALLLLCFWVGFEVFTRVYQTRVYKAVTSSMVAIFLIGMLAWWLFGSGDIVLVLNRINASFVEHYFPGAVINQEMFQYAQSLPSGKILFNNIGGLLFWVIALPGCFYMISRQAKNLGAFNVAAGGMFLLGLSFVASVGSWADILGYRWHYYAGLFLAIPLAISIYLFASRIRIKSLQTLCVTSIVIVIAFLMVMSPLGNTDAPLFRDSRLSRYALTDSELQAVETILKSTDRDIATDSMIAGIAPIKDLTLLSEAQDRIIGFSDGNRALYTRDFTEYRDSIIFIRKEISQNSIIYLSGSPVWLDYDPARLLAEEGFSNIYESVSVDAFYWNYNDKLR
ncbi:hypothetical protein ACFLT8_05620 [Chloroflexota bacterium]